MSIIYLKNVKLTTTVWVFIGLVSVLCFGSAARGQEDCPSGYWLCGETCYKDCKDEFGSGWVKATSRCDCKKPQSYKDEHKEAKKCDDCWSCRGSSYKDCKDVYGKGWVKATSRCDCKKPKSGFIAIDEHEEAKKCDDCWSCRGSSYKDCKDVYGSGWVKATSRCDCKKPQSYKDKHKKPEKFSETCLNDDYSTPNGMTFLFAHGLNGNPREWRHFADRVRAQGFNVWSTQVKKYGHIHERGNQLAKFIEKMHNKCQVKPKSVIAVGHSMGGLDLRYIVGQSQNGAGKIYKNATDLFRSVYTIATPHLGDPNACAPLGGQHDLCGHPQDREKKSPMKKFNVTYPASDFSELDINFTALYYECKEKEEGEDGVVLLESQKWLGAWENQEEAEHHLHNGGKGFHKTKDCSERHGCKPELCQDEEIDWIMEQEVERQN